MNLYNKEHEDKLAKKDKLDKAWKLLLSIEQQVQVYTSLHNRKPDTLELWQFELDLLLFYVQEQGYNIIDPTYIDYCFGDMKIVIK